MNVEVFHCKASCPICGRGLFRGRPRSYVEGNCPKCGKHLEIQFFDRGVQVMVDDVPDMTFPAKEEGTSMKEVKLNMPKR